jgi:hypothetical protein
LVSSHLFARELLARPCYPSSDVLAKAKIQFY